jgi:type II secretory pathway pseudopilin PulG
MPRRSTERGAASLVEVLLAIAIVGIGFAGVLGGLSGAIIGTRLHQDRSEAQLLLTSAADLLRSDDITFTGCDPSPAEYEGLLRGAFSADDLPQDWSTSDLFVTEVLLWDGEEFTDAVTEDECEAAVDDADEPLLDLHLVTIEVRSPDLQTTEAIAVVKGR